MDENRFEQLMSQMLDDEMTTHELSEFVELLKENPSRQQELHDQLEAAEMLAQSEDSLRQSTLFLAAVDSRVKKDPFVTRLRTAISADEANSLSQFRGNQTYKWFGLAATIAAAFLISLFYLQPQEEPVIAKITRLEGAMQWTGDGGHVQLDLDEGQVIRGGTLESLAADSWVELEFLDGSVVTISGQSVLTISELLQKELHLRKGNLSANVKPQPTGKPLLLHTPTARLEVLGTQFNVDTESASTVLTVNEGKVRVTRLSDGKTADVPAEHQVVASASRVDDFKVAPRPQPVSVWKSDLPEGIRYGKWVPKTSRLRAMPMLWRGDEGKRDPVLLFLTSISASRGEQPPIELQQGAKFHIRGHIKSAHGLLIGLTAQHLNGGFAGRHRAFLKEDNFPKDGGDFDLVLDIDQFAPDENDQQPQSPIGLGLIDWWCLTVNVDAGLSISSAELIQPEVSQE